jgi:hypothetical protein
MNANCLALLSAFNTAAPSDVETSDCMEVSLSAAGRLSRQSPNNGIANFFSVPRGRLDMGIDVGGMGARLRTATVRSATEGSYIGIDGESVVLAVEIIEARWTQTDWGLTLNAGMVEDLWVGTQNQAFGYRTLIEPLSQRNGWMGTSDLGTTVAWTSPKSIVTLAVQAASGEGGRLRERNDGLDTSGLLTVRLPTSGDLDVSATGFARDGSKGILRARNHRIGGRLDARYKYLGLGFSHLKGLGYNGQVTPEPTASSAWLSYQAPANIDGLFRADFSHWGTDGANSQTFLTAIGTGLPIGRERPLSGALFLGWRHDRFSASAATLAGADGFTNTDTLFIQLQFNGRGTSLLDQ